VSAERQSIPQVLRPYQQDAVAAIRAACDKGEKPICAMATGLGKTTVIAQALVEMVNPHQQRALVIAHTAEIIYQLYERIANQFGGALDDYFGFMKPGIGLVMGDLDAGDARIVVATRQSLHRRRLEKLLKHGAFDVIVIDEMHHSYGGNTYGDIVKTLETENPSLKRFGLSATPKRGDRHALESLWSSICYELMIADAVMAGHLAPITRIRVATRVDVNSIKTQRGDYDQSKLVSALEAENWLELCLKAFHDHVSPERSTLAFMPTITMSRQLADGLNGVGIAAAHIDGETPKPERAAILKRYSNGDLRVVSNFAVLTEGFDAPLTDVIFLGRPTRSRTLLTQIIGRGVRLFPGKTQCLVIDMAVQDTKMLDFGTLAGKMITCPKCMAEYYAFLDKCSLCGAPRPRGAGGGFGDKKQNEEYTGGELVTSTYNPLFADAFAAWYSADDGSMSCMLAFGDGAVVILPPESDEYYRLYRVPDSPKKPVVFMDRDADAATLVQRGDAAARRSGGSPISKDARWRDSKVSEAQITRLGRLGVTNAKNLTKGQASAIIAHSTAMRRLIAELAKPASQRQWVLDMERTGYPEQDRDRLRRVIARLEQMPGDEQIVVFVRGGALKDSLVLDFPKVRTKIDSETMRFLVSEQIQAHLE